MQSLTVNFQKLNPANELLLLDGFGEALAIYARPGSCAAGKWWGAGSRYGLQAAVRQLCEGSYWRKHCTAGAAQGKRGSTSHWHINGEVGWDISRWHTMWNTQSQGCRKASALPLAVTMQEQAVTKSEFLTMCTCTVFYNEWLRLMCSSSD